jgi:hypothetical protein
MNGPGAGRSERFHTTVFSRGGPGGNHCKLIEEQKGMTTEHSVPNRKTTNEDQKLIPQTIVAALCVPTAALVFLTFADDANAQTSFALLLFIQGAIVGILSPRRLWMSYAASYLGLAIGYLVYSFRMRLDPLMPVGLFLILPIYSLNSLVGLLAGSGVRRLFAWITRRRKT